ncbi:glycosyl hydrolase family 28-related protein [Chitinophaga sp. 212800010-3]|uniref:glycosyl hydrolase family 28-related protein n=1 Tax=unclassified Chitinophaga TaxID=2619133 RepID=UPI002DE9D805|nr:Pectate-lyase-3 domain-containing protein [Chitinophaga sp. 212800010-3]
MLKRSGIIYKWLGCFLALMCAGIVSQAQLTHGTNVRSFGAKADGKTDDIKAIQAAIDKAKKQGSRQTFIPAGHYLISRAIRLPSNFTLTASPDAYICLKPSSNDYLLRNEDMDNGNAYIKVTGGKWNGNGYTQTRTLRNTVAASDFCFGFFFYKVQQLEVAALQIDSTRSWGIAYMECDSVHIHDIHFQQNPFRDAAGTSALMNNGDGVTGGGNHVLIENISGFTNDDLVAFAAGGACFQGKMAPFPAYDYRDVTVRNIFPQPAFDSIPALRGVSFYTFEGRKVSGITIDNVKGNTASASVLFYSLFNKTGYFSDVKVAHISGTNAYSRSTHPGYATLYSVINVKNSVVDRIIFSDIERTETRYSNPLFSFDEHTVIDTLMIQRVNIFHKNISGNLFLSVKDALIRNSRITDIIINKLNQQRPR